MAYLAAYPPAPRSATTRLGARELRILCPTEALAPAPAEETRGFRAASLRFTA
jgi:hypothetical protein